MRRKTGFVVLAKGGEFGVKAFFQIFFIFDYLRHGGRQIESPGEFAGGPQAGKARINGRLHFVAEFGDHFVWLKNAVFEVAFVLGQDVQGAFFPGGGHVNAKFLKLPQYLSGGVVFGDIEASFVPLKSDGDERNHNTKLLSFCPIKKRGMVAQLNFPDHNQEQQHTFKMVVGQRGIGGNDE